MMTPLAAANADVLRRLADTSKPVESVAALAAEFSRDPDNFRKTMKRLESEGLVELVKALRVVPGGVTRTVPALSDAGRDVVRRLDGDSAAGATPMEAPSGERLLRIRPDRLKPNPDNPRKTFDPVDMAELAETILEAGDIIEPLVVSDEQPDGLRFIWAGERRWRAARMVLEGQPLLGTSLGDMGLPCVERVCTPDEAMLLALIENSQRVDLTAYEDAVGIWALHQAKGWNASEIARKLGRAVEGSVKGVKDVQDKLKIMREASPAAQAQYQRDGSWDRLRDSVREKGEAPPASRAKTRGPQEDRAPSESQTREAARTAIMATLPDDEAGLLEAAAQAQRGYHRAVMAGDGQRFDALELVYQAAVYKLNGGTSFGCNAGPGSAMDRVERYCAQVPGRVPQWGQSGEFLVEAGGMRVVVVIGHPMGSSFISASYNAVDLDKPFLSNTGYRSDTGFDPVAGLDIAAVAVKRIEAGLLEKGGKPKPIDHTPHTPPAERFPWLANPPADAEPEEPTLPMPEPAREPAPVGELPPLDKLLLIEIAHKIAGEGDVQFVQIGAYWTDLRATRLQTARLIEFRHDGTPQVAVTDDGAALIAARLPITDDQLVRAQREFLGDDANALPDLYATEWLNTLEGAEQGQEAEPTQTDIEDQPEDPQIAEDRESLRMVEDLVDGALRFDDEIDQDRVRALCDRLGLAAPFRAGRRDEIGELLDGDFEIVASIDVHRENSDPRAAAIAGLIALALNRLCGEMPEPNYEAEGIDEDGLEVDATDRIANAGGEPVPVNGRTPAIPIRRSIQPDFIVCLEDGRRFKSLKRHLRSNYNLSPDEYRERWGLPADYPMTAPNYAKAREELARAMGVEPSVDAALSPALRRLAGA